MNFRRAVVHFLLLLGVSGGVVPAIAQNKAKQGHGDQGVVTDAAGRTHQRTTRVTHAQRKAVALRMKQARVAKTKSQTKATGVTK